MRHRLQRTALATLAVAVLGIVLLLRAGDDKKVYSKRRDLPLLASADSNAKSVAKAAWNEELSISERQGRWLKVEGKDGEGWVYVGNVATEKLPEENTNDLPVRASNMNAAAAGKGMSPEAEAYAGRHSLSTVAEQLKWAEKISADISDDAARAWLKNNKIGEYAQAP